MACASDRPKLADVITATSCRSGKTCTRSSAAVRLRWVFRLTALSTRTVSPGGSKPCLGQRSGMSPEAGLTGGTTVSLWHVASNDADQSRRVSGRTMRVCIVGVSGKLGQYMVQHGLDRG